MTDFDLFDVLLARLPPVDPDDIDRDSFPTFTINRALGAHIYVEIDGGTLTVESTAVPDHSFVRSGPVTDETMIQALGRAMLAAYALPESDDWEPGEYGYTDSAFVGTESWEDQKQYDHVRKTRNIPDSWYILKVIRFDSQKLLQIMDWLKDNCVARYERVGWASGCSTTVGIAFENQHDAIMYTLRWK